MSSHRRVGIVGLGVALPQRRVTNRDLEQIVETTDEWIRTRTGILERRIAGDGETPSVLGAQAAQAALQEAGVKAEDVDLIVVATTTSDMLFPSTSCLIQHRIGNRKAGCFDVSAACAGFVYALSTAHQFVLSGQSRYALVIGAEVLSKFVNWKDRSTCVLFGDGAGAAVVASVERGGIESIYLGADGEAGKYLKIPAGGSLMPPSHETIDQGLHYLQMDGKEVFKFAVRIMGEAAEEALRRAGKTAADIDCLVPHQANHRIIESAAERMRLPMEKVYLNVSRYGNMSSASTVVALAEAVRDGTIKRGDTVVLVAFGAGLAWGSCVLEW